MPTIAGIVLSKKHSFPEKNVVLSSVDIDTSEPERSEPYGK